MSRGSADTGSRRAGRAAWAHRRAYTRFRRGPKGTRGSRSGTAGDSGALPSGGVAGVSPAGSDHDPGVRVAGDHAAGSTAGHAVRSVSRTALADLREDHLRDRARRTLLRRHVSRGGRTRRHAARCAGADQGRGGLRQGDDDGRPVQRTRGPRTAAGHRRRAGRGGRRGAPARVPGERARRRAGRMRGGDPAWRGHHRARYVPAPAPGPAERDGRVRPGARANTVWLLLGSGVRHGHRPDRRETRIGPAPGACGTSRTKPAGGGREHASGARRGRADRTRQ
jgi:hypothetical protein